MEKRKCDPGGEGVDASPPKKLKSEWSKTYSNKAVEMMKKMGYERNKGLGKQSQGMLEPLTPLQHDGRRGLGLKLNMSNNVDQWDPNTDTLTIPETISWLCNNDEIWNISFDSMQNWISFGTETPTLENETNFCMPVVLNQMLEAKTSLDNLNETELRRARSRSNPYETIRNAIFLNRAAVKMANIDALCNFMFTNPKDISGSDVLKNNDLLLFADICAGPGGFSEYILYRKSWGAKGFGFTLRGANDFTLDKFFAGPSECFDPFYGVKNDGNVFDEDNQNSFANYVFKHCNEGVHFVMADGGFSVEGHENIQEILSKQLYVCQCLTALKILRLDGHFVCKLFDLFTPFSVGLIYLMYKCFRQIAIVKPNSSRPANSERYLICKWKKNGTDKVTEFLNYINQLITTKEVRSLTKIVDMKILTADKPFFNYIYDSNNLIGRNQTLALKKVIAFSKNHQLRENRQNECRKTCLQLWKVPDKLRQPPEVKSVEKLLESILETWYDDKIFFSSKCAELDSVHSLEFNMPSSYDWYFVPIGREETNINVCSFFLCKSKGNLLRYAQSKKWEAVDYYFEVPFPSLFYGEIVYEYSGQGKTQTRICCLHVIDAIMLGGKDVRRLKFEERASMCSKFSESISKPFKEGKTNIVRGKPVYKFNNIESFFCDMQRYMLKDGSVRLGLSFNSENRFFVPGGILAFCEICHNFYSIMSKSRNILYYYDKQSNKSYYKDNMPNHVKGILYASFRNSFQRRLIWRWTIPNQVEEGCISNEANMLHRFQIKDFIKKKTCIN